MAFTCRLRSRALVDTPCRTPAQVVCMTGLAAGAAHIQRTGATPVVRALDRLPAALAFSMTAFSLQIILPLWNILLLTGRERIFRVLQAPGPSGFAESTSAVLPRVRVCVYFCPSLPNSVIAGSSIVITPVEIPCVCIHTAFYGSSRLRGERQGASLYVASSL